MEAPPESGRDQIDTFTIFSALWYLAFCIRILMSLDGTQTFGTTIRNIERMVLKSIKFILFLIFTITAFSAYFLLVEFGRWPWATKIEWTFIYLFNA
jgi:hypothetical protein